VTAGQLIYTGDVIHYWEALHTVGASHLPYRDVPWEFPPVTLLVTLPAAVLPRRLFQEPFVVGMVVVEYLSLCWLRAGLVPTVQAADRLLDRGRDRRPAGGVVPGSTR